MPCSRFQTTLWRRVLTCVILFPVCCLTEIAAEEQQQRTLTQDLTYLLPDTDIDDNNTAKFASGEAIVLTGRTYSYDGVDYVLVKGAEKNAYGWVTTQALKQSTRNSGSRLPGAEGNAGLANMSLLPANEKGIAALNEIGMSLLADEMLRSDGTQNVSIAPNGIWTSLYVMGNGAAGKTRALLQEKLGTLDATPGPRDTTYSEHTALWHLPGVRIASNFKKFLSENGINSSETLFDPSGIASINKWYDQATGGLIEGAIDGSTLRGDTQVLLANAAYFNANWQYKFDENNWPISFRSAANRYVEVRSMSAGTMANLIRESETTIVQLPYENTDIVAMLVIPDPNVTADIFAGTLRSNPLTRWQSMLSGQKPEPLSVTMPPFTLRYRNSLTEAVRSLGLSEMLGDNADFSALSDNRTLKVADLVQEVVVECDASGTRAAQATTTNSIPVGVGKSSRSLTIDRPFGFLLVDGQSNALLFACWVPQPTELPQES